jgi:hypothetical protein
MYPLCCENDVLGMGEEYSPIEEFSLICDKHSGKGDELSPIEEFSSFRDVSRETYEEVKKNPPL